MRKIPLRKSKVALVDDADFVWLNQWKWSCHAGRHTWYAACKEKRKTILMHRLILKTPDGMMTDHRDGNGLNNQRKNLRIATRSQNQWNSIRTNGKSKKKGVVWDKNRGSKGRWLGRITFQNKTIYLGLFDTEFEAAQAYNKKAKELFGKFAQVNN